MSEESGTRMPAPAPETNAPTTFWDELVASQGDLPELLQLIVRRAAEVIGDAAVLTVLSGDGAHLEPAATYHADPDVLGFVREVLATHTFPIGEGVVGRVASYRVPEVVNGIKREAIGGLISPTSRPFAERYPIRALLIVPMVAGGELVGTLGLVRISSSEPYVHEDVLTATALAERAAVAIADARGRVRGLDAEEYRAIFRYSLDGVLFSAPDGRVLAANPAACEILGMTEGEICRRGRRGLLDADDPATIAALEERARNGRVRAQLPMRRSDGEVFPADLTSVIFSTSAGDLRAVVIFRDVTAEVGRREELEQRAKMFEERSEHDPLTGLRNRRGFVAAAVEAMAIGAREGRTLQLLYFDLDDLKATNDSYGHLAGDELIGAFAASVSEHTRATDVSARLGGDEFVLLLFSAGRAESVQVVERIAESFRGDGTRPGRTFAVGHAELPPGSTATIEQLIDAADREMYEAKARRREEPTATAIDTRPESASPN